MVEHKYFPILPKLSPIQYQRIRLLMLGFNQVQIGEATGVSKQAVGQTIYHADWLLECRALWIRWLQEFELAFPDKITWEVYAKHLDLCPARDINYPNKQVYSIIHEVRIKYPEFKRPLHPTSYKWRRLYIEA